MTLDDFLQSSGQTDTAFARLIGVSSEAVRRYRAGTRMPEKQVMQMIALHSGGQVTANDFYGIEAAASSDASEDAAASGAAPAEPAPDFPALPETTRPAA